MVLEIRNQLRNYDMTQSTDLTRRQFVGSAALLSAGVIGHTHAMGKANHKQPLLNLPEIDSLQITSLVEDSAEDSLPSSSERCSIKRPLPPRVSRLQGKEIQ